MLSSMAKLANSDSKTCRINFKNGYRDADNNAKIKFHSTKSILAPGYKDNWIINEVLPAVRFDPEKQMTFIKEVHFKHYVPNGDDVFLDVGAGIGMESMFVSRQADFHGRIYAIEASPFTFELLKANIHSNHLNNIRPFNVAISDRPGKLFIDDSQVNHIANSVFTDKGHLSEP
jgi:hypothetical protein